MSKDPVISDEQYTAFMTFYAVIGIPLSLLGIISNTINVKTFTIMGLGDGVTISFLVLSFTDLCFLVSRLLRTVSAGFMSIERISSFDIWFPIDPDAMNLYFAHIGHILYSYTILITTFVCFARCMCVVKPLTFKHIFTRKLSILVLAVCLVFCVICFTPIFAHMGITYQHDQRINSSRLLIVINPQRELIRKVTWCIRDVGIGIPSQLVVVICVIVQTKGLIEASKFRHRSRHASANVANIGQVLPFSTEPKPQLRQIIHKDSPIDDKDNTHKLRIKDLHVVQQVVLISTVFITCNTPKIMITIANLKEERLALGEKYENTYMSMNLLTDLLQMINASVGLFIYYKYNSKFKNSLKPKRLSDSKVVKQEVTL